MKRLTSIFIAVAFSAIFFPVVIYSQPKVTEPGPQPGPGQIIAPHDTGYPAETIPDLSSQPDIEWHRQEIPQKDEKKPVAEPSEKKTKKENN